MRCPFCWRSISGRTSCGAPLAYRKGFGGLRSKTLSPALSPERRISFEHALSHSPSRPYGEYPSCKFYRLHRKVGVLFVGVASRDELLAARKMHAARGSAAAKPTLSPTLSPRKKNILRVRIASFDVLSLWRISLMQMLPLTPQRRCPFCWRIPSICPRREQKSRFLYRFPVIYAKTKSDGRQN